MVTVEQEQDFYYSLLTAHCSRYSQLLSYRYLNKEGMKINDKRAIPTTNNMLAPGQCIILNSIPINESDKDKAPVKNASFFMYLCF